MIRGLNHEKSFQKLPFLIILFILINLRMDHVLNVSALDDNNRVPEIIGWYSIDWGLEYIESDLDKISYMNVDCIILRSYAYKFNEHPEAFKEQIIKIQSKGFKVGVVIFHPYDQNYQRAWKLPVNQDIFSDFSENETWIQNFYREELKRIVDYGESLGISYYVYDDMNFEIVSNLTNAQIFIDITNELTKGKAIMLASYPPMNLSKFTNLKIDRWEWYTHPKNLQKLLNDLENYKFDFRSIGCFLWFYNKTDLEIESLDEIYNYLSRFDRIHIFELRYGDPTWIDASSNSIIENPKLIEKISELNKRIKQKSRLEQNSIIELCKKLEKDKIPISKFLNEVYLIITGKTCPDDSLRWWVGVYEGDPSVSLETRQEVSTNLFWGTNTPIVGTDRWDSTRSRTLALLIARSLIPLPAEPPEGQDTPMGTLLYEIHNLEKGGNIQDFIKRTYLIVKNTPPSDDSLRWWVGVYEGDPSVSLETRQEVSTNLFWGTNTPIVGVSKTDSTRARTLALLIMRSQLSLSSEMKRPSGSLGWEYPITVIYGAFVSIFLILLRWHLIKMRVMGSVQDHLTSQSWWNKRKFIDQELLKPKLAVPLVIGLLIRLLLAPFTEQRWDMYNWRLYPALVFGYGVNPFKPQFSNFTFNWWGYPPLWLFLCLIAYRIFVQLWPISYPYKMNELWIEEKINGKINISYESYRCFIPYNLHYLDLLIKFPIIISDMAIGILIYKIIKDFSGENDAIKSLYAWIFNPLGIFVSSIWGMFDPIPSFFTIITIYYLFKYKHKTSAIMLGIGSLFKLYNIVLLPVISIFIYQKTKKLTQTLKYILVTVILISLVIFTTFSLSATLTNQNPIMTSIELTRNLIFKTASQDQYMKNRISGLTPLVILIPILEKLSIEQNIPISPALMSVGLLIIILDIYRKRTYKNYEIIYYLIITHFLIYLTYSVVHIPHLIWVLPLLLLSKKYQNSKLYLFYWSTTLLGILSIIIITNMPGNFDLSYFISPQFLWTEIPIRIPTSLSLNTAEFAIFIALYYIYGITLSKREIT